MFVCTVRAGSVKFFAVLALVVATAFGILLFSGGTAATVPASGETYRFTGVREEADRVAFFAQFGIAVSGEPETEDFLMPAEFDRVMLGYNEIQKTQGLDLSKYTKKKVTRYTYALPAESGKAPAYATLLVYRYRVIAADVTTAGEGGAVYSLLAYAEKSAGDPAPGAEGEAPTPAD